MARTDYWATPEVILKSFYELKFGCRDKEISRLERRHNAKSDDWDLIYWHLTLQALAPHPS